MGMPALLQDTSLTIQRYEEKDHALDNVKQEIVSRA